MTTIDGQAFVDFYRRAYPDAARLALLLTGSTAASDDLAQEALLRVGERFASIASPDAYLRSTLANLAHSWHRSTTRRRAREERVARPEGLSDSADELLDVLARLPFRQRAVLVMRYWADWSEADIAAALGCRPGTVKAAASRGLARLRRELEEGA